MLDIWALIWTHHIRYSQVLTVANIIVTPERGNNGGNGVFELKVMADLPQVDRLS